MKKNHRRPLSKPLFTHLFFLLLILICGVSLAGCGQSSAHNSSKQKKFDQFLDSCFKEFATENTITLHFKLSDPSSYGIKKEPSPTYGELSSDTAKKNCKRSKQLLQELYTFPTSSLTKEQKLTWQIFQDYLNETIMSEKYILYSSPFGADGLPSDIPVTLSEYRFDNEKDIKDYLSLVNQIPELFTQVLDFEEERRNADIVSPDFVISDTIDQINQFLNASEENNLLVESFEERLDSLDTLSEDQKASYTANNRLLITNKVFPAYEHLKTALQVSTGSKHTTSDNSTKERLCEYENGQDYYRFLLQSDVGTDMSPEECITALETQLKDTIKDISSLTTQNKDLYTEYLSAVPTLSKPKEIMEQLKDDSLVDFPEIKNISYELKNVPNALSGTSACAFYLVPPIDSKDANIIYINNNRVESNEMFSTLAHEGYPGHLYQTQYFASTSPSLIRNVIKPGGYIEGWASYVEVHSYEYAGDNTLLNSLVQCNYALILCLYAKGDIGVNYYGWTEAQLSSFLTDYGFSSAEAAHEMYTAFIANPANYCKYVLGFLGFEELKKQAQKDLGDNFSLKEFHRYILETGPVHIDILFDYLKNWENRLVVSSRAA